MTPLQLEITKLIGKKELSFGCKVSWKNKEELWNDDIVTFVNWNDFATKHTPIKEKRFSVEIIGHPATLSDLHRWMNENKIIRNWYQDRLCLMATGFEDNCIANILYDSSKDLLDQSEETLTQIIELIKSHQ